MPVNTHSQFPERSTWNSSHASVCLNCIFTLIHRLRGTPSGQLCSGYVGLVILDYVVFTAHTDAWKYLLNSYKIIHFTFKSRLWDEHIKLLCESGVSVCSGPEGFGKLNATSCCCTSAHQPLDVPLVTDVIFTCVCHADKIKDYFNLFTFLFDMI